MFSKRQIEFLQALDTGKRLRLFPLGLGVEFELGAKLHLSTYRSLWRRGYIRVGEENDVGMRRLYLSTRGNRVWLEYLCDGKELCVGIRNSKSS